MSLIELAFADISENFTFAYISDSHIQHIKGREFVRNWDQGLKRAVAETNLLNPKPDFVLYGGDIAQLGTKPEIDHGLELLSPLQKLFRNWNFWTEDAEEIRQILHPFHKVTVIYGHVHQIQYNQIGNTS